MLRKSMAVLIPIAVVALSCAKQAASPANQLIVECKADDNAAKADICLNMLPARWNVSNDQAVLAEVYKLVRTGLVYSEREVRAERKAGLECRRTVSGTDLTMNIAYKVPKELERFPSAGTNDRDLVVGQFVSTRDDGCWESRYGFLKKYGNFGDRAVQFLTVSTEPSGPADGANRMIGRWRSWGIDSAEVNGTTVYTLAALRDGAYVLCAKTHYGRGAAAFISCGGAGKMHDSVAKIVSQREPSAVERAFNSLLEKYSLGDSTLTRLFDSDPFDAAAWGRCGNLGCCAAE